jgi:predicted dehydrogenase
MVLPTVDDLLRRRRDIDLVYVRYGMDVQEDALRRGGTPRDTGWGLEPEAAWGRFGVPGDVRAIRTEPGAYQDFYAGVAAGLRDGRPMPVDPEDAIAALAIIEAVRDAAGISAPRVAA